MGGESYYKFPRNILRNIVPYISKEKRNGIIDKSHLKWCTLPLDTYIDDKQIPDHILDITHPSIIYIPNKWNGYSHWLAATPYPQSIPNSRVGAIFENSCIFFSNSLGQQHPVVFKSILKNPIITMQEAEYNSDPEIYFSSDEQKLYCLTRKRLGPEYITKIVMQSSTDGHQWSDPKPILISSSNEGFFSPCLIKHKNEFRIYVFHNRSDSMKTTLSMDIWHSKTIDKPDFMLYKKLKWESNINIWHGGIFIYNDKYYLIGCGTKNENVFITGQKDISKYLYLGESIDGENFKMFNKPILKMNGVYRASAFIDESKTFVCYVSLHNRYKGDKLYPAGNRIAVIEYPFNILLNKLSAH